MKNKILLLLFVIVVLSLIAGCEKDITKEEALAIAQGFVNENVKFYTANESATDVLQRASITIEDARKINDEWNIRLYVSSNANGEVKKSGLIVVVDAKTGEVKKNKLSSFVV